MRASTIIGFLLMCVGFILLVAETELNNTTDYLYFLFIKVVGFAIGYFGYQMSKDYELED